MNSAPAHVRWSGAAAPDAIVHPATQPAAVVAPRRQQMAKRPKSPRRVVLRRQAPSVPSNELHRLLDIREVEVRLERLRLDARDIEEHRRAIHVEADCPLCSGQLGQERFRHMRQTIALQRDTLRVDIEYFEQRLEQLQQAADDAASEDDDSRFVDTLDICGPLDGDELGPLPF